jgi:hypothetical protein
MGSEFVDWSLRAVLISVSQLDRSASFYQELMGTVEAHLEDRLAIIGSTNETCTLYLREAYRNAPHVGPEVLGLRTLSMNVGSFAELDRVEQCLRAHDSFRDRQVFDDVVRMEAVRGYDPDRLALSFIAHEAGRELSPSDLVRVATVLYGIDV